MILTQAAERVGSGHTGENTQRRYGFIAYSMSFNPLAHLGLEEDELREIGLDVNDLKDMDLDDLGELEDSGRESDIHDLSDMMDAEGMEDLDDEFKPIEKISSGEYTISYQILDKYSYRIII